MKPRKIARKNIPMDSPLPATVIYWLALDYWKAPGWAWGVVGTLVVVAWIVFLVEAFTAEYKEIL